MLHGSAVISLLLLVNSRSCWNIGNETEAFSEFKRSIFCFLKAGVDSHCSYFIFK